MTTQTCQEPVWEYDCVICALNRTYDRSVAEGLEKGLTSYKLPRTKDTSIVVHSYTRIWVHLLEGAQALTDDIRERLNRTRWLILVCSPGVKASNSVNTLISYFYSLGRKANVLPLLVEGEPLESFPTLFFEERETNIVDADGHTKIVKEITEPLAADIRSHSPKASLKLLSHARIKVVAALIGVSYDTLEQRHYKRARRRAATLAAVLVLLPIILASIFGYLWLDAERQIAIADQKTAIAKDLFMSMCSDYPEKFASVPEAEPAVNNLLITNLMRLKAADSLFLQELELNSLLEPQDDDDFDTLRCKAALLRYTEKKEEALEAYSLASLHLSSGSVYFASSQAFVALLDSYEYPCGICVLSIEPEISDRTDLAPGDIIVSLDGYAFRSMAQYQFKKESDNPDKVVPIEIIRLVGDSLEHITLKVKPKDLEFEAAEL